MSTTPYVLPDGCRIAPRLLVPAPPACERQTVGRLYSVAAPLNLPAHGENGIEWEPDDCGPLTHTYCLGCTTPGDPKDFDPLPELRNASPFSVYGSSGCSGPGWTPEQLQARARQRLTDGEEYTVEREFIHAVAADPDIESLDVGQGVSIVSAMVRITNWGADLLCLPTIHVPAGILHALASFRLLATTPSDAIQRLHNGSPVVAGLGYDNLSPTGVPGGDAEFWIYATGTPRIWRGDIFEPSNEAASAVDRANNDKAALAERTVVTGYDCGAAYLRTVIE